MVENFIVIGGLTQRITDLKKKNSELKSKNLLTSPLLAILFFSKFPLLSYSTDLENFEKETKAKEVIIASLEERCQAKDR